VTQSPQSTVGEATLDRFQDSATTRRWKATIAAAAPGFDEWIVAAVFGGTYQYGDLSDRDRQLLTIGALVAQGGVEPQLSGHFRSASRVGVTDDDLTASLVHLVPYVGLPRVMAALRTLMAEQN
jgi:4-carboxymuconolactone decarboxylase